MHVPLSHLFPFLTIYFVTLLASSCVNASIIGDFPAAIVGTYNVSFLLTEVPIALAQSFLPTSYSLLPPNKTLFPSASSDQVPLFIELGREADAGPPGLNFEDFQEAKLEVPNVKRLDSFPDTPFLYKRWIAVDNSLDVVGSLLEFGLNTSLQTFSPPNSSNSPSFTYSILGSIDATLVPLARGESLRWPLETFQNIGSMPWFADYPTCAQHFYDWTALDGISFLEGNVTLYPPFTSPGNSAPATFPAQAVNGVFQFKIVGPLVCDEFV